MKITLLILLLFTATAPAHAVQHWYHHLGKAHTEALGVALSIDSDAPPAYWGKPIKQAVAEWDNETDVRPFMQTVGYEDITIIQNPDKWGSDCSTTSLACISVTGGNKNGTNRVCEINIATKSNNFSEAKKKTVILHEMGHCYSLDHNNRIYADDRDAEDADVSNNELMHLTGCPAMGTKCGVTPQAESTINIAY